MHRQARQVAGILEYAESQEEGGDDGQDQRQRVGHAHRPQAVFADQQFGQPGQVDRSIHEIAEGRVEDALEKVLFEQPDQRAGAEDADELVNEVEDAEQDGDAPHRVHHVLADALREQRAAARGALDDAGCQRFGGLAALAREQGRQAAAGSGTAGFAQRGDLRKLLACPLLQPGGDLGVAAEIEDGQAAGGQPRVRRVPLDRLGDAADAGFDRRVVAQQRVRPAGVAEALGQFADAFAAGRDGSQHRDAEALGEGRDIDGDAARRGLVMHVQRQHHRHAEFGEQGGQRQRPAQVLGIADLDQAAAVLVEQGAHGGALVIAARGQREHARGVEQHRRAVEAGAGLGDLDGRPGIVGDIHVGAGQAVKKDRLADVRVADEEDGVGGWGHGAFAGSALMRMVLIIVVRAPDVHRDPSSPGERRKKATDSAVAFLARSGCAGQGLPGPLRNLLSPAGLRSRSPWKRGAPSSGRRLIGTPRMRVRLSALAAAGGMPAGSSTVLDSS